MKLDGAPVVSKPLPLSNDVRGCRGGERCDGRPALEPGAIARHDPIDLCLLEHDLAHEDCVGILRVPPREIPPVGDEPCVQPLLHEPIVCPRPNRANAIVTGACRPRLRFVSCSSTTRRSRATVTRRGSFSRTSASSTRPWTCQWSIARTARPSRRAQSGASRADPCSRRRPPSGESNAILWYFADGTPYLSGDPFERAQTLQWMFFEQYSHEPYIAVVRFWLRYSGTPEQFADQLDGKTKGGYAAFDALERLSAGAISSSATGTRSPTSRSTRTRTLHMKATSTSPRIRRSAPG